MGLMDRDSTLAEMRQHMGRDRETQAEIETHGHIWGHIGRDGETLGY